MIAAIITTTPENWAAGQTKTKTTSTAKKSTGSSTKKIAEPQLRRAVDLQPKKAVAPQLKSLRALLQKGKPPPRKLQKNVKQHQSQKKLRLKNLKKHLRTIPLPSILTKVY